jgi:hypothetical protein
MALSALVAAIWAEQLGFQAVLDCQARLIAALDSSDTDAIQSASAALAAAMEALRLDRGSIDRSLLELGLKQTEAARIRVKYLTAWNRQKIDRLTELRGQSSGNIYAKPRESV